MNQASVDIPLQRLQERDLSIMESLVLYLKDEKKLTYHEIAELLNRDDRTIWTVHNRASKKRSPR